MEDMDHDGDRADDYYDEEDDDKEDK